MSSEEMLAINKQLAIQMLRHDPIKDPPRAKPEFGVVYFASIGWDANGTPTEEWPNDTG